MAAAQLRAPGRAVAALVLLSLLATDALAIPARRALTQAPEADVAVVPTLLPGAPQQVEASMLEDGTQPSILLVARQALLEYVTQQGLALLVAKVRDELSIPDIEATQSVPIVGDFTLQVTNIRVTEFNVSMADTRIEIMDGQFQLWVTQVHARLTFNWHWEKLGMMGSGDGDLDLSGGNIDYTFKVVASAAGQPQLEVVADNSRFENVALSIHSFSADWLYQTVLKIFDSQIQTAIQAQIASALEGDIPDRVNNVLATLPTSVNITGLPFGLSFEYSIFTLTYVMIKGYGQVDSVDQLALGAASPVSTDGTPTVIAVNETDALTPLPPADPSLAALERCPFASSPFPLATDAVAADAHMASIYLHESIINCLMWGLHRSGTLQFTLEDGTIPNLHLTTDLLAMLVPGLPKAYPHQLVRIQGEATGQPTVSFSAENGTTLQASYRASIFVANETAGNPKICTMTADINIQAEINYDTTVIKRVVARHAVESATLDVNPVQWDNTIAWFVQNYAGLFPVSTLIQKFVQVPVVSQVGLVNTNATTGDAWYLLSADVQLSLQSLLGTLLPPSA